MAIFHDDRISQWSREKNQLEGMYQEVNSRRDVLQRIRRQSSKSNPVTEGEVVLLSSDDEDTASAIATVSTQLMINRNSTQIRWKPNDSNANTDRSSIDTGNALNSGGVHHSMPGKSPIGKKPGVIMPVDTPGTITASLNPSSRWSRATCVPTSGQAQPDFSRLFQTSLRADNSTGMNKTSNGASARGSMNTGTTPVPAVNQPARRNTNYSAKWLSVPESARYLPSEVNLVSVENASLNKPINVLNECETCKAQGTADAVIRKITALDSKNNEPTASIQTATSLSITPPSSGAARSLTSGTKTSREPLIKHNPIWKPNALRSEPEGHGAIQKDFKPSAVRVSAPPDPKRALESKMQAICYFKEQGSWRPCLCRGSCSKGICEIVRCYNKNCPAVTMNGRANGNCVGRNPSVANLPAQNGLMPRDASLNGSQNNPLPSQISTLRLRGQQHSQNNIVQSISDDKHARTPVTTYQKSSDLGSSLKRSLDLTTFLNRDSRVTEVEHSYSKQQPIPSAVSPTAILTGTADNRSPEVVESPLTKMMYLTSNSLISKVAGPSHRPAAGIVPPALVECASKKVENPPKPNATSKPVQKAINCTLSQIRSATDLIRRDRPLPPFESISGKFQSSCIKQYWAKPIQPAVLEEAQFLNNGANIDVPKIYEWLANGSSETLLQPSIRAGERPKTTGRIIEAPKKDEIYNFPNVQNTILSIDSSPAISKTRQKLNNSNRRLFSPKLKRNIIQGRVTKPHVSPLRSEDFIIICEGKGLKVRASILEQASPVFKEFAEKCCRWISINGEEYRVFEILGVTYWAMYELLRFISFHSYNHNVMRTSHMKEVLEKLKIKYQRRATFVFPVEPHGRDHV